MQIQDFKTNNMKEIDLEGMTLTNKTHGMSFYENDDCDVLLIVNNNGKLIARIVANCSQNFGFLDLDIYD